jgi:hypothetical protein
MTMQTVWWYICHFVSPDWVTTFHSQHPFWTEFLSDYEDLTRRFGDWFRKYGYWYHETTWGRSEFQFFAKAIAPKLKSICEKWQIREPLPPSWSGKSYYQRPGNMVPTDCPREEAGAGWELPRFLMSEAEFIEQLPESTSLQYGPDPDYKLAQEFDLRRPLESLLQEATRTITSRKRKYTRKHRQPARLDPALRRRLGLYDGYLKVWDLRESDEKFEYIGACMFPGNRAALQRAKDSYNRAKTLIDGGYKELR